MLGRCFKSKGYHHHYHHHHHITFEGQAFGLFRLHNVHLFLGRPTSLLLFGLHSEAIFRICNLSIFSKCSTHRFLKLSIFAISGVTSSLSNILIARRNSVLVQLLTHIKQAASAAAIELQFLWFPIHVSLLYTKVGTVRGKQRQM